MALSRAAIRRAVKQAFRALGDVPRKCVYKSATGDIVRDHVAGTSTRTTVDFDLPMVAFTKFSERQQDRDPALMTDMKMLFPAEDLPIDPKQSDTVVDDKGTLWTIIKRLSDPAAVLTTLQVRAS